jgi:hypothetical protein
VVYTTFSLLDRNFMAAITFAVNNNGIAVYPTANKSLGFASIWTMLLVITTAAGTMVLRQYQTPLAVGFFAGVVITMAFHVFSMMVLFTGAAHVARQDQQGTGTCTRTRPLRFSGFHDLSLRRLG